MNRQERFLRTDKLWINEIVYRNSGANETLRESAEKSFSTDKKITVKNLLTHSSGIGSGEVWGSTASRLINQNINSVEFFIDFLVVHIQKRFRFRGVPRFAVCTVHFIGGSNRNDV